MKITDYLLPGKQNAIQSKLLADKLGYKTVRDLQKAIERERANGAVILSTTQDGGGYYLPNTEAEVRQFIHTLSNRAKHTREAARSAEDWINTQAGRSTMEGW